MKIGISRIIWPHIQSKFGNSPSMGVFAKNERGHRLTSNRIWWLSLNFIWFDFLYDVVIHFSRTLPLNKSLLWIQDCKLLRRFLACQICLSKGLKAKVVIYFPIVGCLSVYIFVCAGASKKFLKCLITWYCVVQTKPLLYS